MKIKYLVVALALIWYGTVAYFSVGYYHADEHYQIVEFAGLLNNTNTPNDLAWEYEAQIRPATQPVLCYAVISVCEFFSISNPFQQAFILRLLTAILAVFIIYFFVDACKHFVAEKYWRIFLILSYFLWFLPFLNVRFSSEAWSGLLLLLSTGLLLKENKQLKHYYLAGIVLGLSFLFRFQIAIAAFGLIMWLIFISKEKWMYMLHLMLVIVSVVGIGILIDSWYYGEWVFAPFNYFITNLLEGKASTFGTSPWYYYFYFIVRFATPPIGILILLSFIVLSIKKPKSIFIWIVLPFIVVHSIIAHKELRFLFPVAPFLPIIIIMAIQNFEWTKLQKWVQVILKVGLAVLFTVNVIALLSSGLKPPGQGHIRLVQQVMQLHNQKPVNLIFMYNHNPVSGGGLPRNFYKIDNIKNTALPNFKDADSSILSKDRQNVLIVPKYLKDNPHIDAFLKRLGFVKTFQAVPPYLVQFMAYHYQKKQVYELYEMQSHN